MFHLLLRDPIRHKNTLISIVDQTHIQKILPSANFLNAFLICAVKWRDEEKAILIYKELIDNKLTINEETWAHLLELCALSKFPETWRLGLDIWAACIEKSSVYQTRKMFLHTFTILTHLKDPKAAADLFEMANNEVVRLNRHHNTLQRGGVKNFGLDTRVRFFNGYASVLIESEHYVTVLEKFKDFSDTPFFKMAVSQKLESTEMTVRLMIRIATETGDVLLAEKFLGLFREIGLEPCHSSYGRLMKMAGASKDVKKLNEYFDISMLRIHPEPESSKWVSLHESLAVAQSNCGLPSESLKTIQKIIDCGKCPRRITFYDLIDHMEGSYLEEIKATFKSQMEKTNQWKQVLDKYK